MYISVMMAAPWGSLTLLSFHSLCLHLRLLTSLYSSGIIGIQFPIWRTYKYITEHNTAIQLKTVVLPTPMCGLACHDAAMTEEACSLCNQLCLQLVNFHSPMCILGRLPCMISNN